MTQKVDDEGRHSRLSTRHHPGGAFDAIIHVGGGSLSTTP